MKKQNNRIFSGLHALIPQALFGLSFTPPEEGGSGEAEETKPSPALQRLFGLVEETTFEAPPEPTADDAEENLKPGMSLHQAITEPSAEEKAEAEQKEADDAAAKVAARKPAPAEDDDTPIRVVKRKSASDIEAERRAAAEAATERAEAQQRFTTAMEWENSLLEEERDQLELARAAEEQDPVKHKGLAAKTEKFIRDNATRTESEDFDPDDAGYRLWVEKERPALTASEIRKIERERGAATARIEAEAKSAVTLDKAFRMIERPRVKAEADAYFAQASQAVMPEEMAKAYAEDAAKAAAEFPHEYQIVERQMDSHTAVVEEMLALTRINPETRRPMTAYDHSNPQHVAAASLINSVDAHFKKNGGAERMKNGRAFLPRSELAAVPASERGKYWTFTATEIAARSTPLIKARIVATIASENERMKKLGFDRRSPSAAAPAPKREAAAAAAPRQGAKAGSSSGGAAESASDRLMRRNGMIPE